MIEQIKLANFDAIQIGDSATLSKTITEADVIIFAGVSCDFNPLHVNEQFAKQSMFGKRVVHGCISSALISAVIGMKLPGPGALYLDQKVAFKKPVYIGDTLTVKAVVKEKLLKKEGKMKILILETNVYNQDDVLVTEGQASVMVM
jgi:3-hydroxybutyryl-CoA dehydratase